MFDDDVESVEIEVPLPEPPLSNTDETVKVVLEEPYGKPAKLGDDKSCIVNIRHDIGNR